jgi:putative PEP-CTERM system TPR-repeat lipoprotein
MSAKSFKHLVLLLVLTVFVMACSNRSREDLLQEGVRLRSEGNFQGAVVLLKNALEKDPNYFEARYELAETYLLSGNLERAERELQKVELQAPSLPDLPLQLAEVYIRTERADLAMARIEKYLSGHPDSSRAADLQGQAFALKGEMQKAADHFRRAIQLDPHNTPGRLHLAEVFVRTGEESSARELLTEVLEEDKKNRPALYLLAWLEVSLGKGGRALEIYRQLAQTDPGDARALYLAGLHHLEGGEITEGEKCADTLLANFPKLAAGSLLKGMALYLRDDPGGAITHLQQALQAGTNLAANYYMGLSYYRLDKLELALNQFQKMLDHEPEAIQPRLMAAMILLKQQRIDEAVAEVEKVLKRDVTNGMAYNILGSAWMVQGKFDAAMTAFEKATELKPGLVDAHLKKGFFHASRGNPAGAEDELTTALNAAPQILDTRLLLAAHYLRQKNYPAAVKTLKEGLSGKESDALLYNFMAAAYFAKQQPEEALACLRRAKEANPGFFTAYFNLAAYHASRGEYERAMEEYAAVLRQDPGQLQALLLSGQVMEMTGQGEKANGFFRKAAETGKSEGLLALGKYLLGQGKETEAFEVLTSAQKTHPEDASLLEFQGQALLRLGRHAEAAAAFAKLDRVAPGKGVAGQVQAHLLGGDVARADALARAMTVQKPSSPAGYLLLASVYEHRGDVPGALEVLQNGRTNNRLAPLLVMRMAELRERKGELDSARRLYEELLRQSPKNHLAVFALGALHDRQGDKREAVRRYREVLALKEDFVPVLNNLAYLYAENFDSKEEALELARKAYRHAPGSPVVMDTLGYTLLINGRAEEARQMLEKAVERLPGNPTILYHLALACQKLGKKDEAVAYLKKALALGEFPEMLQTRTLLEKLTG